MVNGEYRRPAAVPAAELAKIAPVVRWSLLRRWWHALRSPDVRATGGTNGWCTFSVGTASILVLWSEIPKISRTLDAYDDGREFVLRCDVVGTVYDTLIVPVGAVPKLRRLMRSLALAWEVTSGT